MKINRNYDIAFEKYVESINNTIGKTETLR